MGGSVQKYDSMSRFFVQRCAENYICLVARRTEGAYDVCVFHGMSATFCMFEFSVHSRMSPKFAFFSSFFVSLRAFFWPDWKLRRKLHCPVGVVGRACLVVWMFTCVRVFVLRAVMQRRTVTGAKQALRFVSFAYLCGCVCMSCVCLCVSGGAHVVCRTRAFFPQTVRSKRHDDRRNEPYHVDHTTPLLCAAPTPQSPTHTSFVNQSPVQLTGQKSIPRGIARRLSM
jgi:hypothetical protein